MTDVRSFTPEPALPQDLCPRSQTPAPAPQTPAPQTPAYKTLLPDRRCDVGLHHGTHATTGHYTALRTTGITNLQKSFIIIIGLETRCILQHDHLSNFA